MTPRVLIATPDYPPTTGGIQTLLHGLVEHRRGVDYDVVTLAPDEGDAPRGTETGVHRVKRPPGGQTAAIARLNAATYATSRQKTYDAILAGHIVVAPAARAARLPWAQYVYAKELPHRPRLARAALSRADRVLAISRHTRELALQFGARPDRLRLVPPGIPASAFAPVSARIPDDRTIVTVSRLDDEHKGVDVLLRAIALARPSVPTIRLVVVGDGRLRSDLERSARELGIGDAVEFLGRAPNDVRDRALDECAVFAMLSRVPPGEGGEGFGIVFAEAAARGVPVLAGDEGGARDAVDHGRSGLLVDPRSAEDAAAAIVKLLSDRDLRRRFGQAGRGWARRFAWNEVVDQVETVLRETASSRLPQGRAPAHR